MYYSILLTLTALANKNVREKYGRILKIILPSLFVVLAFTFISFPNKNLEITAFDVRNADSFLIKTPDNKYLIIVNASRIDEDLNWLVRNKIGFDVSIINDSHNYSMLAVQGPKACDLIKSLGITELPSFFSIKLHIFHMISFNNETLLVYSFTLVCLLL